MIIKRKVLNKIKKNREWNRGIWESHPEWSEKDEDINIISDHWSYKNILSTISLTVNDFLEKYKKNISEF